MLVMAKECTCRCTSPDVLKKVAEIAAPWKGREDMLIEVLQQAQKAAGNFIPEDVISVIAKEMGIPKAKVYTVVSFYAFFTTEPRGTYIIRMCKSAPRHAKGAKETLAAFEKALGLKVGETTPDGKFTLEPCECLGICDKAPAVMINDEVYGPILPGDVADLLAKF